MVFFQLAALCFLMVILFRLRDIGKGGKDGSSEREKEAYYRGYDEGFKAGYEKGRSESTGGGLGE